MFPPVFPFRAAGPAGGGGGVWGRAPAPNWPRGGLQPSRGRVRPAHPPPPPPGPAALLLQKQPEKAAVAAFSKGPKRSGPFCLAQEYQPLPLLQFFLGVPQGRSQGAAGDGEAFCHIV